MQQVICNKAPSSKKVATFSSYFFSLFPGGGEKCLTFSLSQVLDTGGLERRILEINKKRVKVVKPGSKTSFPTTEMRGSYAPPFHVSIA